MYSNVLNFKVLALKISRTLLVLVYSNAFVLATCTKAWSSIDDDGNDYSIKFKTEDSEKTLEFL